MIDYFLVLGLSFLKQEGGYMSRLRDEIGGELPEEVGEQMDAEGYVGILSDYSPVADVEVVSPTVAAKGLSEGVQPVAGCPPVTMEGSRYAKSLSIDRPTKS